MVMRWLSFCVAPGSDAFTSEKLSEWISHALSQSERPELTSAKRVISGGAYRTGCYDLYGRVDISDFRSWNEKWREFPAAV